MASIEKVQNGGILTSDTLPEKKLKMKYVKNALFQRATFGCAIILCIILLAIILFVGKSGLSVFKHVSVFTFFFSKHWDPSTDHYGAAVFIIGTIALTVLTMLIAVPASIAMAIFIGEVAPNWVKKILRPILDIIVGIPSIIFGYLGLTILIPLIMQVTGSIMGEGLLASALVLAFMVLPTITQVSDNAIASVPTEVREASYALGATRFQTVFRTILPAAKKGILTASILGMARALGETMAVVMVIGNTAQLPHSLTTPTAVLTSNIVMQILEVPFDSTWYKALFMMAFLLLIISTLSIVIIRKLRAKGV
ncbi:phosphate ABC transporter permease subunit PstC [Bacillus sp. FJAT-49736]|uniref:phosphate ABC transporter permease subunit PstC n=1 Tax=Bacillus sp. FJAT-49736 TaxID=2833582 RepID=UPI001BCA0E73|nr:phosphate ABC transporter permease subunit PstC [Bacillus sp. FJAT-49736]MBS4174352.1 phosphate ABC transporter permease subunit PstC [Bacillus sp. FJAT-49736]